MDIHYPTYKTWVSVHRRIFDQKSRDYSNYGGRGITLCDRWLSYWDFFADMGSKPDGHSIERIDNDGPYSPENCRWATMKEQGRNRRNNRLVTKDGETLPLVVWCERLGRKYSVVKRRIQVGTDPVEALRLPTEPRRRVDGSLVAKD